MKIQVYFYPSCTWELEGDTFFCTHDETEVYEYENLHMDMHGNVYDEPSLGYVCAGCGKALEGDPDADRAESIAEMWADEEREYGN